MWCRLQGITQVIDTAGGRLQNIAEFRLANAANGYLNVEGTVRPAERSSPGEEAVRVDVRFLAFSLKVGALPALKIPLEWASPTVCKACKPSSACRVPCRGLALCGH